MTKRVNGMADIRKADRSVYGSFSAFAEAVPFGRVYPLSMTDGRQSGDIYTDGRAVLFWHHCGFGCISGDADSAFIDGVYRLMKNGGRRLVIFADKKLKEQFSCFEDITAERRLFFEFPDDAPAPAYKLPDGFDMSVLDNRLIPQLTGRIVPAFSWEDDRQFLKNGYGCCVTCDGKPCAWAFSAAVGGDDVDIGVETAPEFQRRGLAYCAAADMTDRILKQGKKPVWACHEGNRASAGLAEKLGFVKTGECFVLYRQWIRSNG